MKHHRIIWLFVALHLVLAICYAVMTPYRQGGILMHQRKAYAADIGAPDERQHANYVAHLASAAEFPVFNPKDPNLYENYQSHQPPLFYVLSAGVLKLGDTDIQALGTGRRLRFFNALIGSAGVLGIFFFALWGFRSPPIAYGTTAFAALLPMNVALSGAVSNDPLLFALCSWTLAFAARGIQEGWNTKAALTCGVLMGLAFLTKTTAVALWPVLALALYLSARDTATPQHRNTVYLLALLLPLLIAAPWWLRNQSLYGDPLAMKAFTEAFVGSPQAAEYINHPRGGVLDYWVTGSGTGTGVAWWTLRSFFGVFGYMDIFLSKALYAVLSALLAMLVGMRLLRGREIIDLDPTERPHQTDSKKSKIENPKSNIPSTLDPRPSKTVSLMGGFFFLLVLALFLRFNSQYFQGQARYLFPAIAPISATVGIGIVALFGKKQSFAPWAVAGALLLLNLYVLSILPAEFEKRISPPPTSQIQRPSALKA